MNEFLATQEPGEGQQIAKCIKSFHFAQTSGAKNSGENNTGKNKNKKVFNCLYWFFNISIFPIFLEFCNLPGVSPGRLSPASPRERPVLETSIKNLFFPGSPREPLLSPASPREKKWGKKELYLYFYLFFPFFVSAIFSVPIVRLPTERSGNAGANQNL